MDLLVLAKEPVPGRVKTRLCPPCTAAQAAAVAEAALADTLEAAVGSGADRIVLALDGAPGDWCPTGVKIVAQGDGLLADRLATAWRSARGPALQIGMDTPQVDAEVLRDALDRLEDGVDAVFGQALDGGWWAIGFRSAPAGVFEGIPTSRDDTGGRQLARIVELGLTTELLPSLRDVDEWRDAVAVAARHPHGRFAAAVRVVQLGQPVTT